MASVLALISKSVYEKLPSRQLGEPIPLDRYTSKHAAFAKLGPGDAIFLVTVRPKGPLLVAILDAPKRKGDALVGTTNTTGLAFITDQIPKLKLADGKGITAKLDKLGMSLQTPRVLAEEDVALLRGVAPESTAAAKPAVQMKVEAKKSATDYPKLKGGKLSAGAKQLVEDVYKSPDDRALRGVLADQLLEDQHVWGELISLQMTDPKKHADRIDAIIHQHAREIVGDIANVAAREDLTIEDGFLVAARCGKSKSFTSATQRLDGAKAHQWATVTTVMLTYEMPGTFVQALLHNPASRNLTKIQFDRYDGEITLLSRKTPRDPWSIESADGLESVLLALPDAELARIPRPNLPAAIEALDTARKKRAKPKPKPKPKPKKKR
jgi:hypothetical protein